MRRSVIAGHERNDEGKQVRTRSVAVVQTQTVTIAGMESAVVDVRDYENGKVIEHTIDYYAQRANGDVLYMGEDVNDIENGKVVSHGGQWRAGRRGAKAGLFMPAKPRRGRDVPPGAGARRRGGRVDDRRHRPHGHARPPAASATASRRATSRRWTRASEHKYYCRGVGLVREDVEGGNGLLSSYDEARSAAARRPRAPRRSPPSGRRGRRRTRPARRPEGFSRTCVSRGGT